MPPAVGTGFLWYFLKLGLSINKSLFKKNFSITYVQKNEVITVKKNIKNNIGLLSIF